MYLNRWLLIISNPNSIRLNSAGYIHRWVRAPEEIECKCNRKKIKRALSSRLENSFFPKGRKHNSYIVFVLSVVSFPGFGGRLEYYHVWLPLPTLPLPHILVCRGNYPRLFIDATYLVHGFPTHLQFRCHFSRIHARSRSIYSLAHNKEWHYGKDGQCI